MDIKGSLHPIDELSALSDERRATLKKAYINTVEELLGLVHSQPEGVQQLLHLEDAEIRPLRTAMEDCLDAETLAQFEANANQQHSYGASVPSDSERFVD